jgi:hypothetical protein
VAEAVGQLGDSLLALADKNPNLAWTLAQIANAVADEAARSPRFGRAFVNATRPPTEAIAAPERRRGRRPPGPFDPFALYAEVGEQGLRGRLADLPTEQLKDIVAEHGMDHDRLAMRWKDPTRLIERIIERVKTRSVKGDVFRSA